MQLKRLVVTNILIIVTALAVIGILVFNTINTTLKNQFIHSNQLVLENGADLIEEFVKRNKDAVLNIAIDPFVQQQLDAFNKGNTNIADINDYVLNHWNHRYNINLVAGFLEIFPLLNSDLFAFDTRAGEYRITETEPWMKEVIEKDGAFSIESCEVDDTPYIRISMLTRSIREWPGSSSIIALYIKSEVLLSMFYKIRLENSNHPYLVNGKGKILLPYENVFNVSEPDLLNMNPGWWRHGDQIIINTPMTRLDWKLMGILQENDLMEKSRNIKQTFVIVGGLVVMFLIFVSVFFSIWITRPISNLAKVMSKVEQNEFREIDIDPAFGNETKQLYNQFNYMIRRINSLIDEVYLAQIREKEAELLALQQQINPHFLYNTLDSIAWMSLAYKAEDMVMSLASMMRYSLNEGNNYISIRDELEQVRNYVGIQEIRYDNQFTSTIKCDAKAMDYMIIKLIIQPLVENAIVHGFKETGNFGHVGVYVELLDNYLEIRVENDGVEIDLKKVNSYLSETHFEKQSHYGLRNVNDRLTKSFGRQSAITFSIKDGKTVATIRVDIDLLNKGDEREEG